ncbi:hypothetical protein [Rhodohalobacter barkolensis]|uniref:TraB family protein n=1 Tax=Rhodohalobacter barkolensis TaxID=2053187 RepID=A0A2N0VJ65_9BACT|nr:hypothetical protein [Rhodohalobacter barkolensis]PKD44235.1 hypothetical protein CWD77_01855 [Rhodohalobacter barkolensis]
MNNITLISTVHEEIGKCNSDQLCEIIEKIGPEVIFLEAPENSYSEYDKMRYTSFGVLHKKLELSAIQKYSIKTSFDYVPVLDKGLSDSFEKKYDIVCEKKELQNLIDNFNSLAAEHGFKFLNSTESIKLHEEMRMLESRILNESEIDKMANEYIDAYENSMLRNIYSYCKTNKFNKAIFMCGVAHRISIIKKIEEYKAQEEIDLSWTIFGE